MYADTEVLLSGWRGYQLCFYQSKDVGATSVALAQTCPTAGQQTAALEPFSQPSYLMWPHIPLHSQSKMLPQNDALARAAGPAQMTEPLSAATLQEGKS